MELPSGNILGPFNTREEWLEIRKHGIGGSDTAAILGLSSFTSALEVYQEKYGYERERNEHMDWGTILEPVILEEWTTDRPGVVVDTSTIIIQSRQFPFLLHSPDGLAHLPDGSIEGVEVKNIRSDQNWDPVPEAYYAQVQHGLLCSGLDKWNVVALVAGSKLICREILPDSEFMGRIATECERFWADHIVPGIPPAPDGSESAQRALDGAWDPSEGSVEVDPNLLAEYESLDATRQKVEKDQKKVKQLIQAQMGEYEAATLDGTVVATWKPQVSNRLDITRLRAELPEIADKYTKPSTSRVFRVK